MRRIIHRAVLTLAGVIAAVLLIPVSIRIGKRIQVLLLLPPAEKLLRQSDELADNSDWLTAAPLYKQAEGMSHLQANAVCELYAKVSRGSPPRPLPLCPRHEYQPKLN